MDVNFLVLLQPSVHLVEGYFDEVFEITLVMNSDSPLGSATPHYEVVCGGRCAMLWVPQVFFRHCIGKIEKIERIVCVLPTASFVQRHCPSVIADVNSH